MRREPATRYMSRSVDEDLVMYYRYGLYNGSPFQEVILFIRLGTNGSDKEDPRALLLYEHPGVWIFAYGENYLGDTNELEKGEHPLHVPLAPLTSLCTEDEYAGFARSAESFEALAARSAHRLSRLSKVSKDHKAAILRGIGLTNTDIDLFLS